MSKTNKQEQTVADDLKGLSQLVEEGTVGVMALVESMHLNVLTLGGLLRWPNINDQSKNNQAGRTSGLTGLIYRTINKTSALSFKGVNLAMATFSPLLPDFAAQKWQGKTRNQWLSALNGVLGDHLVATDNPLQINMQLMYEGQAIEAQAAAALMDEHDGESLLLVHGLCMNDELWSHQGHDLGEVLAKEHNLLCFYLRYNTGKAIHQNGQQLSGLLENIAQKRKGKNHMNLLCHSMGGLVSRSALYHADQDSNTWHQHVKKAVFLGTPHQGATLEKAGNALDYLLTISPYSAPFAKLTRSRSQGIQDLQLGRISAVINDTSVAPSLPSHIEFHAIAGSRSNSKEKKQPENNGQLNTTFKQANAASTKGKGDGLVSVASALGQHKNFEKLIGFKAKNKWLISDCDHMELLGHKAHQLLNRLFNN